MVSLAVRLTASVVGFNAIGRAGGLLYLASSLAFLMIAILDAGHHEGHREGWRYQHSAASLACCCVGFVRCWRLWKAEMQRCLAPWEASQPMDIGLTGTIGQ